MPRDAIDHLCHDWATVRRQLLGITSPRVSSEYLGAMHGTLANVQLHRDSAGSRTVRSQHFPEVYTGDALLVNLAFKRMPEPMRAIMDAHFTVLEPRDKRMRADLLGMAHRTYWEQVKAAKRYIEGYLAGRSDLAA